MSKSIYNFLKCQPSNDIESILKIAQSNLKHLPPSHPQSKVMCCYVIGVIILKRERLQAFMVKYENEMNSLLNQAKNIIENGR